MGFENLLSLREAVTVDQLLQAEEEPQRAGPISVSVHGLLPAKAQRDKKNRNRPAADQVKLDGCGMGGNVERVMLTASSERRRDTII